MFARRLQSELFSQLAEPFTAEAIFDTLTDLVYFVKNAHGEYVVLNQTLVNRLGRHEKSELIGRRADEVFPGPLGRSYRAQDERVLQTGQPILNQLELHFRPTGGRGWCLTHKLPLRGKDGRIVGLVGVSKDLHPGNEKSEHYLEIAAVIRHIQTRFDEPLKVKALAAGAGLSEYQFERRLRRIFQLTAGQFIQKTRMEAALHRLRDTDDAIATVSLDCGYSDQSAFTRQFRQTVGLSPSGYRRSLREPAG